MFQISFIVLSVVAALVSAQSTDVSTCRNNAGALPINTSIEGCTSVPCLLPQLEDAVINLTFKAPRDVVEMKTLATAYIRVGLITVPFPYDLGGSGVTCDFLTDAACPLQNGQLVNYSLRMYIEPFFPVGTSVDVEFRIVDDSNESFLCLRVPITVAAPRSGN